MRVKVPVTGTLLEYNRETGEVTGDPNDPIRVDIDLGNVSWELVSLDVDKRIAKIEVVPSEIISKDTGQKDAEGKPIIETRPTTETERQVLLDNALAIAEKAIEGQKWDKHEISP
jgi:hypothetical protein